MRNGKSFPMSLWWCYSSRVGWWPYSYGRDILVAHELIERGHLCLHDLGQLCQLRVNLDHQLIIDSVRLISRRRVSAGNYTCQGCQLVVEPNRIVQGVLTALVPGLIQALLDASQIFLQRRGRIVYDFVARLTGDSFQEIVHLFADIANLEDR